jgi:hypothetical protein
VVATVVQNFFQTGDLLLSTHLDALELALGVTLQLALHAHDHLMNDAEDYVGVVLTHGKLALLALHYLNKIALSTNYILYYILVHIFIYH